MARRRRLVLTVAGLVVFAVIVAVAGWVVLGRHPV